jgi:hypothetical protein
MEEVMALFSRKRPPAKGYVQPPELQAGVVVLARPGSWRVVGLNAGGGAVPLAPPAVAAATGSQLADAFRQTWRRALDGAASVPSLTEWIGSLPADEVPGAAVQERWREFFLGGGAVFKVVPRPAGGIAAQRYVWYWPLTEQDVLWPGLRRGDQIEVLGTGWRERIEDGQAWAADPSWARIAAWMRDRAGIDPRASAWWIADKDGRPGLAVNESDALAEVEGWWAGAGPAFGSAIVQRFDLPVPYDEDFWYGWLRWDPSGSPRPDGLASVLGMRRAGESIEVLWWDIGSDGRPRRPVRGQALDGGPVDIDLVVQLCAAVAATERRGSTLDWVEVRGA